MYCNVLKPKSSSDAQTDAMPIATLIVLPMAQHVPVPQGHLKSDWKPTVGAEISTPYSHPDFGVEKCVDGDIQSLCVSGLEAALPLHAR